VSFGAKDGAFVVGVGLIGRPFTVDSTKLHFTIRRADATTPPVPFAAQVGAPVLDRSPNRPHPLPPATFTDYGLPVVFPDVPARPGMYEVGLQVDPGFTRYEDGTELPDEMGWPDPKVYWPDEAGDDAALRTARSAIENHTVYGYGGIVLSCGGASFRTYLADVGVHVRSVERRRGTVQRLWTGSLTSWGDDSAYSFLAVDPLAIRAEYPSAKWSAIGGTDKPAGDAPCPGFTLADPWQVDVTLTTLPPPPMPAGYEGNLAIGMSRSDVAWMRGYPQGYATRAALDALPVWEYRVALMDHYTVTFRNGRVASFTVPPRMP
jgi:hypothetical protein